MIKKSLLIILLLISYSYGEKIRGEYATKNLKGQDYYLQNCSSCHGEGSRGGNMASIREWAEIFKNNADELIFFHEDDDSTKNLVTYLKGKEFKKQSKLMVEFLQEFAYDSQHIPTCN